MNATCFDQHWSSSGISKIADETIKQTLKQCYNILRKENSSKYTNMNPTAQNFHATIKLHKQNTPIGQIINWKNASAYELLN
jgi:hypothetical protein